MPYWSVVTLMVTPWARSVADKFLRGHCVEFCSIIFSIAQYVYVHMTNYTALYI